MGKFTFDIVTKDKNYEIKLKPRHVYIVGYSGRDMESTMAHIKELEEQLGVAPPKAIPTIFEVSRETVTKDDDLFFVDDMTSGEAEYVIIKKDGKLYIGAGSDHTDRRLESVSITKSKQVCLKPISKVFWEYDEIKDHMDDIKINSKSAGKDYQSGTLGDILPVEKILDVLEERLGDVDNCIIYAGTIPLLGDFMYDDNFYIELIDEKLDRKITVDYNITVIPNEAR